MQLVSPNFADILPANFEIKNFPDGDSYVRILEPEKYKGQQVTFFHRLYPNQNDSIAQALLVLSVLKKLKCEVTMVAPYLPYSRQDKTFHEGEAESAKIICNLLAGAGVKKLVTFDCHFLKKEGEFKYGKLNLRNISLSKAIIEHAREKFGGNDGTGTPFEIISPDEGANYLVEGAGGKSMKKVRGEYETANKDEAYRTIESMERNFEVSGKNVLIIDDMISTGGTMVKAAENLKKGGAKKVGCATTHGFFLKDSLARLRGMCDFIFASDTIQNEVSEVKIGDFVASL
ncbi:TPA: ribose-phosphate pyrophosphokinase [Candidatus Micrarchaeota archaeon]|nr:ribose-phosphate pyrophosphokinase [Candidatus Micrarchaeota archaeon]